MTREEFVDKLILIYEKKKELKALSEQRHLDEVNIAIKYKVNDCNAERSALVSSYASEVSRIQGEIKAVEDSI